MSDNAAFVDRDDSGNVRVTCILCGLVETFSDGAEAWKVVADRASDSDKPYVCPNCER